MGNYAIRIFESSHIFPHARKFCFSSFGRIFPHNHRKIYFSKKRPNIFSWLSRIIRPTFPRFLPPRRGNQGHDQRCRWSVIPPPSASPLPFGLRPPPPWAFHGDTVAAVARTLLLPKRTRWEGRTSLVFPSPH